MDWIFYWIFCWLCLIVILVGIFVYVMICAERLKKIFIVLWCLTLNNSSKSTKAESNKTKETKFLQTRVGVS